MKRLSTCLLLSLPVGTAALIACAVGTPVDDAVLEDYLAAMPADAGADSQEEEIPSPSEKLPPPSAPPADAGADAGDAGPKKPDAGGGGGNDAGTKPAPVSCDPTNTCMSASELGTISGDTSSETKSAQGHTSRWFTVRVTENDDAITGISLWATATLVSPPGANFDLYLYVPNADARECNAVSTKSESTTDTDKATAKFGEAGLLSNGVDDDRTITIEVRHVSGSCNPSQPWTLTLEGNK